jgi:hypothetical protein
MATVNKRVGIPQATIINGVDTGGIMTAVIQAGFDNVMRSSPDGLQVPMKDKEIQSVRGAIVTQDWIEVINLLTGAVGTYVFYERKSGVAPATGYVKHTITAPVIHQVSFTLTKGGYSTANFSFECKAADETKGIADMWVPEDSQAAPSYVSAARGGYRVETAAHGAVSIYHVMDFNFALALPLVKACNDLDVGYTCVDARLDGLAAAGSISFQDASISAATILCQKLAVAARGSLVLVVTQGGGAADKTITIAGVDFNNVGGSSDVSAPFTGYSADFEVSNDTGTLLTLEGTNKIITIA